MEFKEWYRLLNFSREKVRYRLKDGDDTTECLAEHRIFRSDDCENYIDISDILSISDDRLEIRKFKPYGNLENTIEEYYDSSELLVLAFEVDSQLVNGFVWIKDESDDSVKTVHLTLEQLQDIMYDIDNWVETGD